MVFCLACGDGLTLPIDESASEEQARGPSTQWSCVWCSVYLEQVWSLYSGSQSRLVRFFVRSVVLIANLEDVIVFKAIKTHHPRAIVVTYLTSHEDRRSDKNWKTIRKEAVIQYVAELHRRDSPTKMLFVVIVLSGSLMLCDAHCRHHATWLSPLVLLMNFISHIFIHHQ